MNTKKVILISGHPNIGQSYANRFILEEIEKIAPDFEIRYLDKLYPQFEINVLEEQQALINADIIVWQVPIQWFSAPAIFKRWQDDVLVHGFAYGSAGNYLKGKKTIVSVTVGGEAHEYAKDDLFKHTLEEFILPLTETIPYCGMQYGGLVSSADMTYIEGAYDQKKLDEVKERAEDHARKLLELIIENSK